MSVTTKTGDQGMTSLFTGERIAKDDMRVEVYGAVDSLGSTLGMARAFATSPQVKEHIYNLQKQLGMLMADFASRNKAPRITEEMVTGIEKSIADIEESLPELQAGVHHPGGQEVERDARSRAHDDTRGGASCVDSGTARLGGRDRSALSQPPLGLYLHPHAP